MVPSLRFDLISRVKLVVRNCCRRWVEEISKKVRAKIHEIVGLEFVREVKRDPKVDKAFDDGSDHMMYVDHDEHFWPLK